MHKPASKPLDALRLSASLIWQGPSVLTGESISVFALPPSPKASSGVNGKTGGMLQTYIIPTSLLQECIGHYNRLGGPDAPRSEVAPVKAFLSALLKGGGDRINGLNCPHRSVAAGGAGSCYTHGSTVNKGLASLLRGWLRRGMPSCTPQAFVIRVNRMPVVEKHGYTARIGTYGEPTHVPSYVWKK